MTRSTLSPKRRALAAVAGGASLALVLTACGGSGGGDETSGSSGEASSIDCAPYEEFGDLDGTSVNVYTSIVDP